MFGGFIALSVFLAVFTIIGLVVLYFVKDKKEFDFRMVFSAYFYLVAMLSLLAVLVGLSGITKAVLSDVYGRDFSYYNYASDRPVMEPAVDKNSSLTEEQQKDQQELDLEYQKQQAEQIESQYQDDLFTGISTLVVGLLFLVVHVLGWMRMEPAKARQSSFLYKAYVMMQLVVYSLIALIALPTALSTLLRFMFQSTSASGNIIPGESLSVAIWATPVWVGFVWLTMRTVKARG